jgi:hypothetical protein
LEDCVYWAIQTGICLRKREGKRMGIRKLFVRFMDWVDSFGRDAGDHMVNGAVVAALLLGLTAAVVAMIIQSPALLCIGFVLLVAHLLIIVGVL